MLLSHLDRMEIHKRQRQASLILPFIQQLSRIEEESKFAFLKFETSHASFKMWIVVHGKKKKDERMSSLCINIYTVLLRKGCHHELTMALTLVDDRQEYVLYISMCTHIVHSCLLSIIFFHYDSVCCIYDDRCIHIDIKANKKRERKRKKYRW
jgi:hypothetical protein